MIKKNLIILLILIVSTGLISAMVCEDSFDIGEDANICGYCNYKSNGSVCSSSITCYFDIYYSNFTEIIINANATNNGDGSVNYSLGTGLSKGTYLGQLVCNESNVINRDDLTFTVGITTENAPLTSASVSGTIYEEGEEVRITTACLDVNNHLVDSNANVTVYYPNNTVWFQGDMSEMEDGLLNYTTIAPDVGGVYTILTTCDDGTNYAIGMGELQIPSWVTKIVEINQTTYEIYDFLINDMNVTLTSILNLTNLTYESVVDLDANLSEMIDCCTSLRTYLEDKWGTEDADEIVERLKDIRSDVSYLRLNYEYLSVEEQRRWLLNIQTDSREILDMISYEDDWWEGIYLWIIPIFVGMILLIIVMVYLFKRKKPQRFGDIENG